MTESNIRALILVWVEDLEIVHILMLVNVGS